jgi:SOS-response transcriptional repressor LexA
MEQTRAGIIQGINTRAKIVTSIKEYSEKHGFSPTVRELGDMVGLKSSSTVHRHLLSLKEEGKISWNPAMPRTIRLLSGF